MRKEVALWVAFILMVLAGLLLVPYKDKLSRPQPRDTAAIGAPQPIAAPVEPPFEGSFPWLARYNRNNSIAKRIAPPQGFTRVDVQPGSFAQWLRHLPLKSGTPAVTYYTGRPRGNASHAAVIDLDVSRRDLQQCADSIIRLRAEYLFSRNQRSAIAFHLTSGERVDYARWSQGYRPSRPRRAAANAPFRWTRSAGQDNSHAAFRAYLEFVFTYAGTHSLSAELAPAAGPVEIGDVFVQGGSPGHAAIVVDVAADAAGNRVFLLAQGFMPAQDMHVLKNLGDGQPSPWYAADFGETLRTPDYTFRAADRKRFP